MDTKKQERGAQVLIYFVFYEILTFNQQFSVYNFELMLTQCWFHKTQNISNLCTKLFLLYKMYIFSQVITASM